jgi:hypothetical protein
VVRGHALSKYAQAARITPFTAKGYLKQVFNKTGTNAG